jgi:penicillin V acylase-like amidase (Ntn superfamily)
MKNYPIVLLLAILTTALVVPRSSACTALMITDKKGNAYSAKTMEYAVPMPFEMSYVPAGTKVVSVAPGKKPGLSFETKYPVLGVSADVGVGNGINMMVEAANNQGLSISTNELPGSQSPAGAGSDAAKALATTDLGLYFLGNFQSVAEVKEALQGSAVSVWVPKVPLVGNIEAPFHYILFDKTGVGIVIEFLDGKMNVHDNPVGVVTNAPEFPWHLKNLNNYAQLTNLDKNSGQFGQLKVGAPDSGNTLASVPSSQISAGRFVKAAFYTQFVRKADSPEDAVITLGHIMNNFDRPYDLSIDKGYSAEGGAPGSTTSEVTLFTWMNDKVRNLYFLRTIGALNYAKFEIDKLTPIKSVVKVPLEKINDMQLDGTQVLLGAARN